MTWFSLINNIRKGKMSFSSLNPSRIRGLIYKKYKEKNGIDNKKFYVNISSVTIFEGS